MKRGVLDQRTGYIGAPMEPRYDHANPAPDPLRLVQEFVNTVDLKHGREWLDTPAALARWLGDRGLTAARATRADLAHALELRDVLRNLLRANNGAELDNAAVTRFNVFAAEAKVGLAFDETGIPVLDSQRSGVAGAIGRLVAVALTAMVDGTWARLKACRNEVCQWSFYDYSKNRTGRWCSMSVCGNRIKTRSYRRRHRAAQVAGRRRRR